MALVLKQGTLMDVAVVKTPISTYYSIHLPELLEIGAILSIIYNKITDFTRYPYSLMFCPQNV